MNSSSSGGRVRVVVTCTDRKTRPAPPDRCARALVGDLAERAEAWVRSMQNAADTPVAAQELYAGEHWHVARTLPERCPTGWAVELWVASAGLGLVPSDVPVAPYAATFSHGHLDSVCRPTDNVAPPVAARMWWARLTQLHEDGRPRNLAELARVEPRTPLVFVGSAVYVSAVIEDLCAARSSLTSPDLFSVVCSGKAPSMEGLLPCDARLTHALGGSRVSLNARIAAYLVETASFHKFRHPEAAEVLQQLLDKQPPLLSYDRRPASDLDIERFIRSRLDGRRVSHSGLLRTFRDLGFACEQGRFREIFLRTTGHRA